MKKLLPVLLFTLFASGCGYNESISQKADKGFLKFVGNTEQVQVVIDEGEPFVPEKNIDLYQLSPGRHNVKVMRNNAVVVNRVIILDNKTTMEINVP